jgi:hypothetical protein
MMRITFGFIFALTFWIIPSTTFAHMAIDLEEQGVVFRNSTNQQPLILNIASIDSQEYEQPKSSASIPLVEEKPKTSAATESPWNARMGSVVEGGQAFVKEIGGDVGKFFTEVKDGYVKIYNDGIKTATDKRNARIARGETPTRLTDFWDGFSSTFVPSFTFSFTKWGWPIVKTIFGLGTKAK